MPSYYYLDVQATEAVSFIGVNGVPVVADPRGRGARCVRPINEWLLPQGNQLTLSLSWPEAKPRQPGKALVRAAVFLADPNSEFPRPLQTLAEFKWPLPDRPETYPYQHRAAFRIPEVVPTRLWSEAPKVEELAEKDRGAILKLVEGLRAALLAKDPQAAFGFLEYRYADDARANYKAFDRIREVVIQQYGWMMKNDLTSNHLDPESAAFELVGDGRLVRVTRQRLESAILLESAEQFFGIEVYAAKIRGVWTLVR